MPCKHPRGIHVVCVRTIHPTQWLHLASYLGKSLQLATVAKLYKSPAYHISTHLSISQAILVIPLSSSTCSPRSVATVNDRTHLPKAGSLATMTTADYTDAWNIPMEKDGWVRAHHTIREDLKDIERMGVAFVGQLKAGKPLSKSQIAAAKRFWGVYYVFLAHHHATEDSIVLPHLQKYTDMPQQLCLDHELIIGATNKLNSMLHEALDNPDGVAASDIEVFLVCSHFCIWGTLVFHCLLE